MITWLPIINKFTFHHQKEYGIIAFLMIYRQSFNKITVLLSSVYAMVLMCYFTRQALFLLEKPH
ncbi:hypothetical protein AO382_0062 [Moraxella catarrhalis]|uniref:Uncharacterized protein n=1 Tax=Moraxella catarrhalis TaxID=480 RepID=A0A7Z1A4G6_MORCA|nr:hypothetical protein AO382_0062 [Moraxella catarrhalis]